MKNEESRTKATTASQQDDFAIRVALIGHVSVGKTTLLNAILGDKYSEVSMKRTTAAVNIFRLHFMDKGDHDTETVSESKTKNTPSPDQASSTLKEIAIDNKTLRQSNFLSEKIFDIVLPEPLVEMREQTKLHLIDVPGINEAGASKKYSTYVSDNWHTFDCVVVVLDGRQGVNTEEQMELLQFVHERSKSVRDIPIITVMNKIDNPEEEEQKLLTNEAKTALQKMFGKFNCGLEPKEVNTSTLSPSRRTEFSPYLVPMSALHAYIYRTASKYDFDTFSQKIELGLIDRLGRDSYGRRWAKFDTSEKYVKAYEIVRDPKELKDALEDSNFYQFLRALEFAIGGAETQKQIIQEQITWNASNLSIHDNYVAKIESMYEKCIRLGHTNEIAINAGASEFQKLIVESIKNAFALFLSEPEKPFCLYKPVREIFAYWELCERMGIQDDSSCALALIGLVQKMIQLQIHFLVKGFKSNELSFLTFTPLDWQAIFGCLLRQSRAPYFDLLFGSIVGIVLEQKFREALIMPEYSQTCPNCNKDFLARSFHESEEDGKTLRSNVYSICCGIGYVESERDERLCYNTECYERKIGTRHNGRIDGVCTDHQCRRVTKVKSRVSPELQTTMSSIFLHDDPQTLFSQKAKITMPLAPDHPLHYGHLIWRLGQLLEMTGMIGYPTMVRQEIKNLGLDDVLSPASVEEFIEQNETECE